MGLGEPKYQRSPDDVRQIKALEEELAGLREALERAARELGIPTDGYPAPVANAWRIIMHALAALTPQEEETMTDDHPTEVPELDRANSTIISMGEVIDRLDKQLAARDKELAGPRVELARLRWALYQIVQATYVVGDGAAPMLLQRIAHDALAALTSAKVKPTK